MSSRRCLIVSVVLFCLSFESFAKKATKRMFPLTRFSCTGKPSGYYADVDAGCQVYHMCDGMGRQFSYECPNMTLFQQRMLICDHWYMVNCSMSERDYSANLLIGQRDKPFVTDDEMRLRTPRPDILAVPPYNPYYDVLKLDAKLDEVEDNDLDTKQTQNHVRSDENRRQDTLNNFVPRGNDRSNSQEDEETRKPSRGPKLRKTSPRRKISLPLDLLPPFDPVKGDTNEEEYDVTTINETPAFKFLKHFNPTEGEDYNTAITNEEIHSLNTHLPAGQVSSEDDRDSRKFKNFNDNLNTLPSNENVSEDSRFNSVNTKSKPLSQDGFKTGQKKTVLTEPVNVLQPPKVKSDPFPSTTIGPPVYYEWRWAVPAFDLVPPKEKNETDAADLNLRRSDPSVSDTQPEGRNPFAKVTRPEPITTTPEPSHVEYNTSSYFVPDYVFPLDKGHPGYETDGAQTSFQVNVAIPGRSSYGENPDCPQCHPAYLKPGSCEPCIIER